MPDPIIGIEGRWTPFETAPRLVEERFDNGWLAALGAYQTTMENILRLQDIAGDLQLINREISIDTTAISTGVISENPPTINAGDFLTHPSTMPVDPQIIDATPDEFPEFPDLVAGDISLINMPQEPGITDAYPGDIPSFPDLVAGDISLLSMPQEPNITDASMDIFPVFPDLVSGDIPSPNEMYSSALMDAIKTKLLQDIRDGSTGLSAAVEDAMFNRESERALLVHNDTIDQLAADWARGGYEIPPGGLRASQAKELMDYRNKRLDVSRDIEIKSFELAVANYHFVIQQGIVFESQLMNWAHSVAVLAAETSRAVVSAQIESFKARSDNVAKRILAIIQKAQTRIEYNKDLVGLFTAKVNAYGASAQAQRYLVEMQIESFKARSENVKTKSSVILDTAKTKVDYNKNLVELYNAKINAYLVSSQAQKNLVEMQIEAYKARSETAKSKIYGIIEKVKAQVEYNKGLVDVFNGKINAYVGSMKGEGDRVNAVARGFEAQVGLFRGVADFDIQKMGLDLKVLDTRLGQAIANANIMIKDKEIEAKNYEVLNSLKIEAMKAAGSISAQLVAGAMAGVSASAHISASASSTYSPRWVYENGQWVLK